MNFLNTAAVAAALTLSALFGLTGASAHEIRLGSLVIHHPWCRPSASDPATAGGYMTITNTGKADDRLLGATAEITPDVTIADGAGSVADGGLVIPAGATVKLKPGARAIRFARLASPLVEDDSFGGTLVFEKAGTAVIDYEVVAPEPGGN